jgi:lipid-A-disaccharide synthase
MNETAKPLHIWLIAGEESGDQLGAGLMRALKTMRGEGIVFGGVGGRAMEQEGLKSLFPIADIAVMGVLPVLARLPLILRRIRETKAALMTARPDILVIIDSPDFTHRVARGVRAILPDMRIINYVSPTVWAWRPGRAKKMRLYIDHVLAVKPFEPAAHQRLGGPPCTYVGHPLIERLAELRPAAPRPPLGKRPLNLVVLPGSRRSEIRRLMQPFGETLKQLQRVIQQPLNITLPVVPHVADLITDAVKAWPIQPQLVMGEAAKFAAFRAADAALAASGTVTLELALSGVPMVVAYKVSKLEEQLKYFIHVPSIVLANLIIGENVIPEFIQAACTPDNLVNALKPLLEDTPERARQVDAFQRFDAIMQTGYESPSLHAAEIVLEGH